MFSAFVEGLEVQDLRLILAQAREANALRARAADLELMLRKWIEYRDPDIGHDLMWKNADGTFCLWKQEFDDEGVPMHCGPEFTLQDEGTGLPILTDEARKALEKT